MTPHLLANLLRRRCNRLRMKYGGPAIDLSGVPDEEIIDRWNDTDAYSAQDQLSPHQLRRAIARCETLQEFQRILRCPTLLDGA